MFLDFKDESFLGMYSKKCLDEPTIFWLIGHY